MKDIPIRRRAAMAIKKIETQVPDSAEARLMFEVFTQAVYDAVPLMTCSHGDTRSARNYIDGPMPHLELAGINAEWARNIIEKLGLTTWNVEEA